MKNMGQALYLLHLRQREQLVGALSEWQQLHEFLQCQQQRQRQLAGAVAIFTPGIIAAFISGTFGICIAFFITVTILLFQLSL